MSGLRTCQSCDEQDTTVRMRECGLALCTVCYPWVRQSLERTSDLPQWADTLLSVEPDIFQNVKKQLKELPIHDERGRPIATTMPQADDEWLDYYRWLLGGEHERFKELELHVDMRRDAGSRGISTIEEIEISLTDKLLELQHAEDDREIQNWDASAMRREPQSIIFGSDVVWVSLDSFNVGDLIIRFHFEKSLAELLFDSMNLLDTRPIDGRYFSYLKPSGITEMFDLQSLPRCPRLREFIHLAATGEFGRRIADSHRSMVLLWLFEPSREYVTRDVIPWSKSFQFLRSVIASSTRANANDVGITVRGDSGTPWRVSPHPGCFMGHGGDPHGEVFVVDGPKGNPVCIIGSRESYHMPFGDILAAMVMMLLDDIKTSRIVRTLRPHMVGHSHWPTRGADLE